MDTLNNNNDDNNCKEEAKSTTNVLQQESPEENSDSTATGQVGNIFYEAEIDFLGIIFLQNGKEMKNDAQRYMATLLNARNATEQTKDKIRVQFKLFESGEVGIQFVDVLDDQTRQLIDAQNSQFLPNSTLENHIDSFIRSSTVSKFPIEQLFFYRGDLNSEIERCLVVATSTFSYPQTEVPPVQFMVFAGDCPAQISDILDSCRRIAERPKPVIDSSAQLSSSLSSSATTENGQTFGGGAFNKPIVTNSIELSSNEFKISMGADVEIQEEISEHKWHTANIIDKDSFKLKANLEKRICITLKQDPQQLVKIEKCFGMLISPGRYVGSSDMVAIGLMSMSVADIPGSRLKQWTVIGAWIPSELNFELLNTETAGDSRVFFSLAIDLIIERIDEPVRFIFELKAKIVSPSQWSGAVSTTEKIWQLANLGGVTKQKQISEQFQLTLRQVNSGDNLKMFTYQALSCISSAQFHAQKKQLSLQLNSIDVNNDGGQRSMDSIETPTTEEADESDDEPLASGTGMVSKECAEEILKQWKEIIDHWGTNFDARPKQLIKMVRKGIPEALRPEVWQLLSGSNQVEEPLLKQYVTLVSSVSKFDAVIRRDISRTFPAHDMFKEPGGQGQESLFRICKAYSNYDLEIGYCQGLSYLVAALLLHMPEEQAFFVLVRIMYHYRLRELYRAGFEELHCKFYQLDRLLQDQVPELRAHFEDLHIETHMFASQWFLTLFTTKFPLNAVFLIIDQFLLDKMNTLLQIAVAMLKISKSDFLTLDFEGIMKYFRVTLPKIYRNEESAKKLIKSAIKINVKKAKRYEEEYKKWQESEKKRLNPEEYMARENNRLTTMNIRLEQENDELNSEIIMLCNVKVKLQNRIETLDDKVATLSHELNTVHSHALRERDETEEEKSCLLKELKNLKDMYREQVEKSEKEFRSNKRIIEDYKVICKNYETKLENEKCNSERIVQGFQAQVKSCQSCSDALDQSINAQDAGESSIDPQREELFQRVSDLEAELIKTKFALAEAEERNGKILGKLHHTNSELNLLKAQADELQQQRSNTWFAKTISSFREAASGATANMNNAHSHNNHHSGSNSNHSGKTVKPSNSLHGLHHHQSQSTMSNNNINTNNNSRTSAGGRVPNPETTSLHETETVNMFQDVNQKRRFSTNRSGTTSTTGASTFSPSTADSN